MNRREKWENVTNYEWITSRGEFHEAYYCETTLLPSPAVDDARVWA